VHDIRAIKTRATRRAWIAYFHKLPSKPSTLPRESRSGRMVKHQVTIQLMLCHMYTLERRSTCLIACELSCPEAAIAQLRAGALAGGVEQSIDRAAWLQVDMPTPGASPTSSPERAQQAAPAAQSCLLPHTAHTSPVGDRSAQTTHIPEQMLSDPTLFSPASICPSHAQTPLRSTTHASAAQMPVQDPQQWRVYDSPTPSVSSTSVSPLTRPRGVDVHADRPPQRRRMSDSLTCSPEPRWHHHEFRSASADSASPQRRCAGASAAWSASARASSAAFADQSPWQAQRPCRHSAGAHAAGAPAWTQHHPAAEDGRHHVRHPYGPAGHATGPHTNDAVVESPTFDLRQHSFWQHSSPADAQTNQHVPTAGLPSLRQPGIQLASVAGSAVAGSAYDALFGVLQMAAARPLSAVPEEPPAQALPGRHQRHGSAAIAAQHRDCSVPEHQSHMRHARKQRRAVWDAVGTLTPKAVPSLSDRVEPQHKIRPAGAQWPSQNAEVLAACAVVARS
jgi:hypothetical protein